MKYIQKSPFLFEKSKLKKHIKLKIKRKSKNKSLKIKSPFQIFSQSKIKKVNNNLEISKNNIQSYKDWDKYYEKEIENLFRSFASKIMENLIKNDCFLLTQEAEKVDYTYYQYSKNGKYIINIVAVFENPINFRVVYEPIELNIKIKGNRKILYGFLFTLLCIIIYIIYRYGKINSDN